MLTIRQFGKCIAVLFQNAFVHTIKIMLGINGENWEDGDMGGFGEEGIEYAFAGNFVIWSLAALVFRWNIEWWIVAESFAFGYVFIMGFFGFPVLKYYLEVHFPTGNGFYMPRRGRTPIPH